MTWAARIDGSNAGLTLDQARKEAKKVPGDVERETSTRWSKSARSDGRLRRHDGKRKPPLPPP
jgi:hypothetical protein